MDKEREDVLATLTKLRQGALLLTIANGYLCEPPLLRKIAREMYRALQILPEEIKTLRSRCPGEPEKDAEITRMLRELHQGVRQLGNAEAEVRAKCSQGDLGREFELRVANLTAAVKAIADPRGKEPEEQGTIHVSRRREFCPSSPLLGYTRRIMLFLLPLVVAGAIAFAYFYLTMEREQDLRQRIDLLTAQAASSRTILKEIERQKDQLSRKLDSMRAREMQQAERIATIELGQELAEVEERQTKVEMEIEKNQEEIGRLNAKLKKMEGKSFLKRLLHL